MSDEDGFDDLLTIIGFGRWQVPFVISIILFGMQLPVQLVGSPLLSAPMDFHCSQGPPSLTAPDTSYKLSYNRSEDNTTYFDSVCLSSTSFVSKFTEAEAADAEVEAEAEVANVTGYFTRLATCPYVEYETSVFASTVASQWHLVCEQSTLLPLFQMMYNIGGLLGCLLSGHIGDRYGRKKAILLGTIINLLAVVLMTTVPYYGMVLAMRIAIGCMDNIVLLPAWSLALESTPTRYRSLVGMLLGLPYSAGVVLFAGIGYYIRSWQYLLLVCATPAVVLLPIAVYLDESPRWLVQQGRVDEATKVLKKAVQQNKAKLSTPLLTTINKLAAEAAASNTSSSPVASSADPKESDGKGSTMRIIMLYLRSPAMRIIFIATSILWLLQPCLYLSVAINANNFTSTDPYLYVALTGIMDGSAILLNTPLATRLGRKIMIFCGMFIGATLFLLDLLVTSDYYWLKWVLVMVGFLLVGGSYQCNYVYAPELFPTEIRASGFALVNLIANVGYICAPLVTDILAKYNWWAGGVFFGCAGIVGSLMIPFLPETRNKPLPETLQDVEDRRNKTKKKIISGSENKGYEGDGDKTV